MSTTTTKTEPMPVNLSREFMALHNFEKGLRQKSDELFFSANLPENRDKNRYSNILPNEQTRVRLQPLPDVPNSDYINANFVRGVDIDAALEHQDYIVTQAPIEGKTFDDFWRMVWENKVPLIIMLTSCKERGMVKADPYWPNVDYQTEFDSGITVQTVSERKSDRCPDVVERQILVRSAGHDETLAITQLQFTGWPDHGVPQSTETIRQFLELTDLHFCTKTGPMIVHCSAGIGRSGTFLTIHIALALIRKTMQLNSEDQSENSSNSPPVPVPNIFNIVKSLRMARLGLVAQYEQYLFCYNILEEFLDQGLGGVPSTD